MRIEENDQAVPYNAMKSTFAMQPKLVQVQQAILKISLSFQAKIQVNLKPLVL